MRIRSRSSSVWWTVVLAGVFVPSASSRAQGQSIATSRSLGGYGATSTSAMSSMGSGSPMIPYAGSFGGFMPYRMASNGGTSLSFSSRGSSVTDSSRTSLRLVPMSAGMGSGGQPRNGSLGAFRSQTMMGTGTGRLMSQPMGVGNGGGVMPPNFGYPFYQPPSLLAPVGSAAGMPM
jgi:hypothetical protein